MTSVASENERAETGMDEYIEREAAIESIMSEPPDAHYPHWYADKIKAIPAANVAPVRHGWWIFGKDLPCGWGKILKNKYHLYCSECLEQAFNRSEDNDPDFDVETSYCPNCGCRMDGGDDE